MHLYHVYVHQVFLKPKMEMFPNMFTIQRSNHLSFYESGHDDYGILIAQ